MKTLQALVIVIVLVITGGFAYRSMPVHGTPPSDISTTTPVITSTTTPVTVVPESPLDEAHGKSATPEGMATVVGANNRFAFDLYSNLRKEPGNLFFSPYSISTALAMAYEGARGKTAEEMQSVFHFPTDANVRLPAFTAIQKQLNAPDAKYKLSIANALWAQKDFLFLNDYLATIAKYYGGKATNLDFIGAVEASRKTINNWVESQTNNKIKNLFPENSLSNATRLVLTNAIYFKGTWVKQFTKSETKPESFHVSSSNTVRAPMMRRTDKDAEYRYGETDDVQVLEIPYDGDQLSMLVLLPKGDIAGFEGTLTVDKLKELKSNLGAKQQVYVYMPKFTFDTKYMMKDTLAKMGMPTAFTDSADFSGMDGRTDLSIDKVIHQAYVAVDEEGTEAAAATGVAMTTTAMPMNPVVIPIFRADHPFTFVIQDTKDGNILFMGRVEEPSGGQ